MKPSEMTEEQLNGRIVRTAWVFAEKIIAVDAEDDTTVVNDLMMIAFCEAFGMTEDEFSLQDVGLIDALNAVWALVKSNGIGGN